MVRRKFEAPKVLGQIEMQMGSSILETSVVNDLTVQSTGQEIKSYNFSDDKSGGFNHQWK